MLMFLIVIAILLWYANMQLGAIRRELSPGGEQGIDIYAASRWDRRRMTAIVWLARGSVVAVMLGLAWCILAINR